MPATGPGGRHRPRHAGPAQPAAAACPMSRRQAGRPPAPREALKASLTFRVRLPEEIVTISGRWVSIKEFPDGDIAVKVVRYDPDVVSIVKTIARANHGSYRPRWRSWNVPRWRAESVRRALREAAETVAIGVRPSEP